MDKTRSSKPRMTFNSGINSFPKPKKAETGVIKNDGVVVLDKFDEGSSAFFRDEWDRSVILSNFKSTNVGEM